MTYACLDETNVLSLVPKHKIYVSCRMDHSVSLVNGIWWWVIKSKQIKQNIETKYINIIVVIIIVVMIIFI